MKIKKIGHCCLLIDTGTIKIMTDPGIFTANLHTEFSNIDIILITHEHADHIHTESLKQVIEKNPNAKIITNTSVGKLLQEQKIYFEVLEGHDSKTFLNILIEAFDAKHEEIFEEFGQVQNTGYLIDSKLFLPGDAYSNPNRTIDILALPVAGPWCKISDAIRYALKIKPKKTFPIHDGLLNPDRIGGHHKVPEKILSENGVEFVTLIDGEEKTF